MDGIGKNGPVYLLYRLWISSMLSMEQPEEHSGGLVESHHVRKVNDEDLSFRYLHLD